MRLRSLFRFGVVGVCLAVGSWAGGCASDSQIDTGVGPAGPGGAGGMPAGPGGGCGEELCNGTDDDCDMQVDEGCDCIDEETQLCYSGPEGTEDVGVCIGGEQTCDETGTWSECVGEVVPSTEVCNGSDDDCNDAVDEGFGSVTCGLGICQVTVEECVDGEPVACIPGDPAPAETCDGTDDDCDGDVDEGCNCINNTTQACYTGSMATQNVGECHDGTQTCAGGQWGPCVGDQTPQTEVCDGLDNDCEGNVDNGNPGGGGSCNTGNLGICAAGSFQCLSGQVTCVQDLQPSAETCNGLDDDCNGTVDQGDPGGGASCVSGLPGICSPGTEHCANGMIECQSNLMPQTEVCNGLDDNCDNVVDDGNPGGNMSCSTGGVGVCAAGTTQCTGGTIVCNQNVQPSNEQCNGLDDNCNGPVDEGNPGGGGACNTGGLGPCGPGAYQCQNGGLVCVANVNPTNETCNSVDDDCNGVVDNGNNACGGACTLPHPANSPCDGPDSDLCNEGNWICSGLNNQSCNDFSVGNIEICNAIDEDCDGNISEGPCSLPNATSTCNLGTCVVTGCNSGFDNCDGQNPNGCEQQHSGWSNSSPGEYLGQFDCDASSGFVCPGEGCDYQLTRTGTRGRFFYMDAHEGSSCCAYVAVKFELVVPPGIDYDLYITGNGCFADPAFQQTGNGNKTITVWCNDDCSNGDNSFTPVVEVRYASGFSCSPWTLNMYRREC
jgi:putative metal-binding protein